MTSTTHTIIAFGLIFALYMIGYMRATLRARDVAYAEVVRNLISDGVLKIKLQKSDIPEEEEDEG